MTRYRLALAGAACAWLASCATTPEPPMTLEEQYEPERIEVPSPFIEYPPIEPVEPPIVESAAPAPGASQAQPQSAPSATPAPAPDMVALAPPSAVAVPPASAQPQAPAEDVELIVLIADLNRYGNLSADDVKREIGNVTQVFGRQATNANRIRLAVLYTLVKSSPQDDQRALAYLENVSKSNSGSPAVKQLALVLQAQIVGRQRAVRDEQQKAEAALLKLEQLRQMERSLMRERARSGGGGGGGSGGGSGGGGGGGGGGGQ
ncbi:MAG: hypothetical protein U1F54_08410 [Burkholderiales bacterium]